MSLLELLELTQMAIWQLRHYVGLIGAVYVALKA